MKFTTPLLAVALAVAAGSALAQDIKVGVTLSATGPAASLGIPERNTFALLPQTIGGRKVQYIVLDDASDTTTAVKNARKLITEDKVDVIVGSTITPNSLAMIDVAAETETPMISMAASSRIVEPVDAKRRWVFKTPQNDQQMALVIVGDMLSRGIKTVGYIGFADAYGEGWWNEFSKIAETRGLKVVANERYQRNDTSVTGQVLKLVAAKPEAILIGASGTPAALPQKTLKERGYAGKIYQTHGVANNDFLRVCGKDCEGTLLPAGPVLVSAQLPSGPSGEEVRGRLRRRLREGQRQGQRVDLRRARLGRRSPAAGGDSDRAEDGAARHQGIQGRAAQRPRKREERRRSPRHLQHEYERPSRSRPARSGDGDDRERSLGAAEIAGARPAQLRCRGISRRRRRTDQHAVPIPRAARRPLNAFEGAARVLLVGARGRVDRPVTFCSNEVMN